MAAITSAAIGVGVSGYMAYQGAQKEKEAKRALSNYNRQELTNPYENIEISTIGSDLIREESGRTSANLVDAVRESGIRGIMGAIPKIQAYTNSENRDAQKYLDEQVQKKEYAIASDEINKRGIRESRDIANIAALSSQAEAGKQDMWNGISGIAKGISYGANNIDFSGSRDTVDTVNTLQPKGLAQLQGTSLNTGYQLPSLTTIDPYSNIPSLKIN